ncbi:urease accessory protein UreD [Aquibacillus koreensis]|uniref:Urease accessory protein UreD n=1 Tax=Aquibacillus koreensis TaxID=279446 RepID=A0A9X3WMT2_9BACI|nr:urease accessory protein UreD [Aquibacillus koreensis]MCT2534163.1 urease accessory protein UreD [Aquibacillus koreensis]MDC3422555.1 urease accessory protein UreD [Aquibacillus koreensis]
MLPLANKERAMAPKSYGKLDLTFQLLRGKTRMVDVYQQPPLKASRELYPEGTGDVTVYLMESSGGLVAGDRNEFRIHVGQGSSVTLRPQSATKVYPAFNDAPSTQQVTVKLEDDAKLEWNREEVIPFLDARFDSKTSIQMTPSSSLLWSEILYPGRDKRGEAFAFQECNTHVDIWIDDQCVVYDALHLHPKKQELKKLGALENYNYIGNFWCFSPKVNLSDVHMDSMLVQQDNHKSGMTTLESNGILIRWLSNSLPLLKKEMDTITNYFNGIVKEN